MNHEATIAYLEQRIAQLSVINDGLTQELRRYKPQTVVSPKGKLIQVKQVTDTDRMAMVHYINLIANLSVFAHHNLAPWQKLLDYHRLLEKSGQMDANITENDFLPKNNQHEVFPKSTNGAKKKMCPNTKAKQKNKALAGR